MAEVMPGCEPWSAEGGDVGLLLLHGFTGSPVSLRPLAEGLAEDGYAVELPRIPGHGTRWQDLGRTTWRDWTREAVASFEILRARTRAQVVFGISGGGALALYLAATRPDEVAGVVLVNPWVQPFRHPLVPLVPLLKWVLPWYPGVINDIAKPGQDEVGYSRVAVKAIASMFEFFRLLRPRLAEVTAPVLVLTSRQDHVVPPENSDTVGQAIGSEDITRVWLERSYHVATLDHDAPLLAEQTSAFVKRATAG